MRIVTKMIPLNKIFLDEVDEEIYNGNVRKPHGAEGPGYQRDPYERIKWINARLPLFNEQLLRPLEVSNRGGGMYVAIDGGGRWLMAELAGLKEIECRIHEGLSREEEAELFELLDSETYKLRAIEKFQAMMSGGKAFALEINDAVAPYRIAKRGVGTLKCVVPLLDIYATPFAGVKLISRTAKIIANTWGGYQGAGNWCGVKKIEGKQFLAVAILIEAAGTRFDEGTLRKRLDKIGPKDLDRDVLAEHGSKDLNTVNYARAAAKILARRYSRGISDPNRKISATDIENSQILETLMEGSTFSRQVREAKAKPVRARAAK